MTDKIIHVASRPFDEAWPEETTTLIINSGLSDAGQLPPEHMCTFGMIAEWHKRQAKSVVDMLVTLPAETLDSAIQLLTKRAADREQVLAEFAKLNPLPF